MRWRRLRVRRSNMNSREAGDWFAGMNVGRLSSRLVASALADMDFGCLTEPEKMVTPIGWPKVSGPSSLNICGRFGDPCWSCPSGCVFVQFLPTFSFSTGLQSSIFPKEKTFYPRRAQQVTPTQLTLHVRWDVIR